MLLPNRHGSSDKYRYGFNGKEKDDEIKGEGIHYDYGFRVYDPRISKFLSIDPLFKGYPFYTPYQFAGNKPIMASDVDGLEEKIEIMYIDGNESKLILFKDNLNNPFGLDGGLLSINVYAKDRVAYRLPGESRNTVNFARVLEIVESHNLQPISASLITNRYIPTEAVILKEAGFITSLLTGSSYESSGETIHSVLGDLLLGELTGAFLFKAFGKSLSSITKGGFSKNIDEIDNLSDSVLLNSGKVNTINYSQVSNTADEVFGGSTAVLGRNGNYTGYSGSDFLKKGLRTTVNYGRGPEGGIGSQLNKLANGSPGTSISIELSRLERFAVGVSGVVIGGGHSFSSFDKLSKSIKSKRTSNSSPNSGDIRQN